MNPFTSRCAFLVASFVLLKGASALAHPGHDHDHDHVILSVRTWTDAQTGRQWDGSYVSSRDGQVQIRALDGTLRRLDITRLGKADQLWIANREEEIRRFNAETTVLLPPRSRTVAQSEPESLPLQSGAFDLLLRAETDACAAETAASGAEALARAFEPFTKRKEISTRSDRDYFYVESNGMPDHPMMIGITAWQQQVPLPQKYTGQNAWRIPLHPKPAATPALTKNRFLRGAIALAVNGVPIFNPLNNRGDDAYLFGELDEYGGHCGRADDYHYHIAPVHLEKHVGKGKPIAYALDGYPIFGYDEPDGSKVVGLDTLNGHKDADGHYHYHATKTYPYLNGGFYGEVVERDGQVDPQPRAQPVREFLPPLQGAKIVDFKTAKPNSFELKYDVKGKVGYVRYTLQENGSIAFQFTDTTGKTRAETYTPRPRPPGGGDAKPKRPRPGEGTPPPGEPKRKRETDDKPPERPAAGPEPKGPAGEARKPWIAEHFAELDTDRDGKLTRKEMLAEAERTFKAYDENNDGKVIRREYDRGGVRTPFAGFVRGHASEVDTNGDEIITKQELLDFAGKLFDKADRDGNGSTTAAEAAVGGPAKKKAGS